MCFTATFVSICCRKPAAFLEYVPVPNLHLLYPGQETRGGPLFGPWTGSTKGASWKWSHVFCTSEFEGFNVPSVAHKYSGIPPHVKESENPEFMIRFQHFLASQWNPESSLLWNTESRLLWDPESSMGVFQKQL